MPKRCNRCKLEKGSTEFFKNKRHSSGLTSWCKVCYKEKKATPQDKEVTWAYYLKRTYGLKLEDYNSLLEAQDFRCKICSTHQNQFRNRLHVDHDHNTGQIRGILCVECNTGLGKFKDNPELLQLAIDYLKAGG